MTTAWVVRVSNLVSFDILGNFGKFILKSAYFQ